MVYIDFLVQKRFRNLKTRANLNEYDATPHPFCAFTRIPNRNAQLMHNLPATTEGDEIMISNGEAANGPDIQAS
jgi:hypothetical protein